MLKHARWSCLLAAAVAFDLSAQSVQPAFRHLGPDQGLSHPDVYSITADEVGILWIATSAGLDRFDGHDVRPLAIDTEAGTTSEDFSFVFRDHGGDLWVGTWGHGLFHLSFPGLQATALASRPGDPSSLSDDRVQAIFEDSSGTLWVSTFNGLNRLDRDRGSFDRFAHDPENPDTLASNRIWGFAQAAGGDLWIAHDTGVDRWDAESETFRRAPGATPDASRARCVLLARDGTLWVGGQPGLRKGGGGDRFVDVALAGEGTEPTINALFEDRDGSIWAGTLGQGLHRVDPDAGTVQSFRSDPGGTNGLAADDVRAFHRGDDDLLWIGTRGGGLAALDLRPSRFGRIATPAVQDVIAAGDGTIWVASIDAVSRHAADGELLERLEAAPGGDLVDQALRLEELDDGRLAIGARSGVVLYDPGSGEVERLEHDPEDPGSLVDGIVWALLADRSGGLWIGTDRGLDRLDPGTGRLTHYRSQLDGPDGPADAFIQTLYEAGDGELWIGTDLAGLFVLDAERRSIASHSHQGTDPDSLADDRVTAVLEDRSGTFWIGSGGGLERVDGPSGGRPPSFRHLDADMPRLPILGLLEDDAGALWASTAIGLYRVAQDRRRVDVYRPGQGLSGSVFAPNAAARGAGGDLLFGGLEGVVRVRAEAARPAGTPPKMAWTGLRVLNQARPFDPWTVPEEIVLAPGQWQFAVDFAALAYRDPQRHRFTAKLDGYDPDWVELGNRSTVSYSRVSPGDYVLRVRAANEDGVWNRTGLALPVRVLPVFHQTLGFRLGLGLVALALLLAADRLRLAGMRHRRAVLEARVRERTAEVESQKAELEAAYRRVEELSLKDPLTGLANRRFLTRTIDATIAHSQRAARSDSQERIVFSLIDIDHFKRVNDRWGHDAGDQVLEQFARRLSVLRRAEEPLVRWGGEEFLLVSRVDRMEVAVRLAERLRRAIAGQPFHLRDGTEVPLACSIGFSPLVADSAGTVSWESVVSLADKALYDAKASGRNAWVGVELAAGVRFADLDDHLHERLPALIDEGLVEATRSTDPTD